MMQWHMQDGIITNNHEVKVDFILPTLSARDIVMCKFHLDESDKGRYTMILGKDILT